MSTFVIPNGPQALQWEHYFIQIHNSLPPITFTIPTQSPKPIQSFELSRKTLMNMKDTPKPRRKKIKDKIR